MWTQDFKVLFRYSSHDSCYVASTRKKESVYMIDKQRLSDIVSEYKSNYFLEHWADENFKWKAVKHFQENWNIDTDDFSKMLNEALSSTYGLLASQNNFPKAMIVWLANHNPDAVRAMFVSLFDESKGLWERIDKFKRDSSALVKEHGKEGDQHYQGENAITTYLWLRYPDKYYIYKYGEVKRVSEVLNSDYGIKKGDYSNNIRNHKSLYDEIADELQQDDDLVKLLNSHITNDCYEDPKLRTLTIDVGFYISRYISDETKDGGKPTADVWGPLEEDYHPGISTDDWVQLLQNKDIFRENDLKIVKSFKEYGGEATCKQLSIKYGESPGFYNIGSSKLGSRIVKSLGCPLWKDPDNGKEYYWPILYLGKTADKDEEGAYKWKLRAELAEALDQVDLGYINIYAEVEENDCNYWWLNANPKIWSFSELAVGDVQDYTLYNDNGNKRRIFQNFLDARAGDMIIGYESHPIKQVVAIARVVAEQDGTSLSFEKVEGLTSPIDYQSLRECPELEKMEYFVNPQGSLFRLTKGEYDFIMDLVREENPIAKESADTYTKDDFLEEVYMTEERYDNLVGIIRNKKNVILQGAPGVGKTFAAKRMAYSLMGMKDEERIEFVQFHQNYSYEDFIMGYKPSQDGFELRNGVFYQFCQKAANHPDKDYYFIIDEINRGNMSKIFGEMLMLIEKDYRGAKVTMAYNGLQFTVPHNVYIIGMMNTADRSLAMIDYALRRRFSFFDMEPGFDSEGFVRYQQGFNSETLDELILRVKDLNKDIVSDRSLGKGFCIGHSYFCGCEECTEEWLKAVVEYDIIPMLSEYWFDDDAKLQRWSNTLRGVFQ